MVHLPWRPDPALDVLNGRNLYTRVVFQPFKTSTPAHTRGQSNTGTSEAGAGRRSARSPVRGGASLVLGLVLIAESIGAGQAPSSSVSSAPRPLAAVAPAVLALGAGQGHAYHQMLRAGEFLHITIEQQGVDIVAALLRPDGSEVVSVSGMDDEFRPETLVAIADVDGRHLIQVRPAPEARTGGRYAIRVEASRPATPEDHRRIDTERTFTRGRQVRDPGRAATWPEALTLLTTALGGFREISDRRGEMKTLIEIAITQVLPVDARGAGHRAAGRTART